MDLEHREFTKVGRALERSYPSELGKTYIATEDERENVSLSKSQLGVLAAWADRVHPAVDPWPTGSEVGAHVYVDNVASLSPLLRRMLVRAVDLLDDQANVHEGLGFAESSASYQDDLLTELENSEDTALFAMVLELLHEGYYRAPKVREAIESQTGYLIDAQVGGGIRLEAFDEELLTRVRDLPQRVREVSR